MTDPRGNRTVVALYVILAVIAVSVAGAVGYMGFQANRSVFPHTSTVTLTISGVADPGNSSYDDVGVITDEEMNGLPDWLPALIQEARNRTASRELLEHELGTIEAAFKEKAPRALYPVLRYREDVFIFSFAATAGA